MIQVNFRPHTLSPEEEKQAKILTAAQIKFLENQLTLTMSERANLDYDPAKPITSFVQQEAALMGQISAYSFLLNSHIETITELQRLTSDSSFTNS